MMTEAVWAALATYFVMLIAFWQSRRRAVHMPLMAGLILFDLCMPFYLYATRDWYKRLIEHGDITSFGVWMHLGLVLTLYVLYAFQVLSVRGVLAGHTEARDAHRGQAKALLLVRGLVVLTGALLAESPEEGGGLAS
jgi:hypothetical protein